MGFALYDHQLKAKDEMHNGCVLKGDVGSGKSVTALAYYVEKVLGSSFTANSEGLLEPIQSRRDLFIITTAKKRDNYEWEEDALPFRITADRETSRDGLLLTVDSWNNIKNYVNIKDAFFIFDEQRAIGSGTWVKSFLKIAKQNEWVMLSATPGDQWMDYWPLFVANGFYKNKTEFVDQHAVYSRYTRYPKVDRWIGSGRLNAYRRRILIEMPDVRHTIPEDRVYPVSYGEALFQLAAEDRWHVFDARPIRDVAELISVLRRIVNGDPSRLNAVMEIYKSHPKLIVFYNFNYELEQLRKLEYFLEIPVAEWNGHKHQPIPTGDAWIYLVQYTAGSEGWNCTTTDTIVFYSLNYSYRITKQARGRIDRLNTPYTNLYYYFLQSTSFIDKAILKVLSHKRNFNKSDERALAKELNFVPTDESRKDYGREPAVPSDPVRA